MHTVKQQLTTCITLMTISEISFCFYGDEFLRLCTCYYHAAADFLTIVTLDGQPRKMFSVNLRTPHRLKTSVFFGL